MSSTSEPLQPKEDTSATVEQQITTAVEQARRAFALQKYEQAVDFYATALELTTEKHGDDAPETADLYFSYGKALLENAIAQAGVLGKDQAAGGGESDDEAQPLNKPGLSFSGDGDEDDDAGVNLFEFVEGQEDEENNENEAPEGADEEPEDDFNAAWEVLDLARAIYEKQSESEVDDVDQVRLKLADTYIALGDVSLETEKFDQAITDYETGLKLKQELLPQSSRQIAEAHYKLSMVLDLTSGRLADAIVHAESALASVEARVAELESAAPNAGDEDKRTVDVPVQSNGKGKGKAPARLIKEDDVSNMSKTQITAEIKDLSDLKQDLALKVEELKTSPNDKSDTTAPVLAQQALDKELNGAGSTAAVPTQVINDLTTMVKKKKKPEVTAVKRKAEDTVEASLKKTKLDDEQ